MPEFFRVDFRDIGEAAGLVADLSRLLASSRVDLRGVGTIEVGVVARGAAADVYLSPGALTATERAFGAPSGFSRVETLPDDIVWILRDGEKKFLGRGDVLSDLIPEPSEPLDTRRVSIGIVKMWRDGKGYGAPGSRSFYLRLGTREAAGPGYFDARSGDAQPCD